MITVSLMMRSEAKQKSFGLVKSYRILINVFLKQNVWYNETKMMWLCII